MAPQDDGPARGLRARPLPLLLLLPLLPPLLLPLLLLPRLSTSSGLHADAQTPSQTQTARTAPPGGGAAIARREPPGWPLAWPAETSTERASVRASVRLCVCAAAVLRTELVGRESSKLWPGSRGASRRTAGILGLQEGNSGRKAPDVNLLPRLRAQCLCALFHRRGSLPAQAPHGGANFGALRPKRSH